MAAGGGGLPELAVAAARGGGGRGRGWRGGRDSRGDRCGGSNLGQAQGGAGVGGWGYLGLNLGGGGVVVLVEAGGAVEGVPGEQCEGAEGVEAFAGGGFAGHAWD